MIKSVVRSFHWTCRDIESLYLDDADFLSLGYWYNDIIEVEKELKPKET